MGLLQREIANLIGVDKTTIQYGETNRVVPAIRYLPKIIEFLGYVPFEEPEPLTECLISYRRLMGLSRKRMAQITGIDESNIAGWETGRHRPTRRSVRILENFLTMSLFCEEGGLMPQFIRVGE